MIRKEYYILVILMVFLVGGIGVGFCDSENFVGIKADINVDDDTLKTLFYDAKVSIILDSETGLYKGTCDLYGDSIITADNYNLNVVMNTIVSELEKKYEIDDYDLTYYTETGIEIPLKYVSNNLKVDESEIDSNSFLKQSQSVFISWSSDTPAASEQQKEEKKETATAADTPAPTDAPAPGTFDASDDAKSLNNPVASQSTEESNTLKELLPEVLKLKSSNNCDKLNQAIQELYNDIRLGNTNKDDAGKKITEIQDKIKLLDNPSSSNYNEVKELLKNGYEISTTGSQNLFAANQKAEQKVKDDCKTPDSPACKSAQTELKNTNALLEKVSATNFLSAYHKALNDCKGTDAIDCQKKLSDSMTAKECAGAWFEGICTILNQKTDTMRLEQATLNAIAQEKAKLGYGAKKEDLNKAIVKALTADGQIKLEFEEMNGNGQALYKYNGGEPKTLEAIRQDIETKLDACNIEAECKKLREELAIIKTADEQTVVTTNIGFFLMDAIKNPDYSAMQTAKYFGFEADYSYLPNFLKESIPSQMCLDKIEGYLDKNVETNGGVTSYGCTKYDMEKNPNNKCLEVLGDLRAQRTSFTPDNKTLITYSYYIKAQGTGDYKVTVKYKQNGNYVAHILEEGKIEVASDDEDEEKKSSAPSSAKGYDSVLLPLNQTAGIDQNSFMIYLSGPGFELSYPILLISPNVISQTMRDKGNSEGNGQAIIATNG